MASLLRLAKQLRKSTSRFSSSSGKHHIINAFSILGHMGVMVGLAEVLEKLRYGTLQNMGHLVHSGPICFHDKWGQEILPVVQKCKIHLKNF